MYDTQPSRANNIAPRFQVPAVRCDAQGYAMPLNASERFDEYFAKRCPAFKNPSDALRVHPKPMVLPDLPEELVDVALAPMWSRRKFSCRDPVAFDKFVSEKYPIPAAAVRDTRPPIAQGGCNSRYDGRPPIEMYKKLNGDAWQREGAARVVAHPAYH